jgi:TetR/AcrR family fatty acid metabolism transcriptional regulator
MSTPAPTTHPVRGRPPIPGLRDSILRAAERVFAHRDFHEVQMDDVAAACGVGKGTVYRYFPSKRELYLAVMFDGIERLRAELAEAARTVEPPARKLERIVRRTLGYFWDRRHFFVLIHQQEHKPDADVEEWFRQRGKMVHIVQDVVDAAITAGQLHPVDSRIATEMLFGMMRGVNRYRTPADSLEALVTTVVELFMHGVGTPSGKRALGRRGGRT